MQVFEGRTVDAEVWIDARELKARVDLAAIVAWFTRLRPFRDQLVGLCPLHSERHPSFYVHPEKQCFKCFGCDAAGDVFDFVMHVVGCDFRHALEIVSEFAERVAAASGLRSSPRFGSGAGAKPLSPAQRGALHSQSSQKARGRVIETLDATNRRLRAIQAANRKASASLATACEPERARQGVARA